MGAAEKVLLHLLTSCTVYPQGVFTTSLAELSSRAYAAPVDIGQGPRHLSISRVVYLLRELERMNQVGSRSGRPLVLPRSKPEIPLPLAVRHQPQHECEVPPLAGHVLSQVLRKAVPQ